MLTVHDPRLFRLGREAFCRALVEQAVGPGGARKAEVCLGTSVMRLTFVPGRYRLAELAERAAAAIRAATDLVGESVDSSRINGKAWTSLTAIVADEQTSIWEALVEKPGRVLLSHRALSESPWLAARLAQALRDVPGVRGCRALPWVGRVATDVDPACDAIDDLVSAAEMSYHRESGTVRAVVGVPVRDPVGPEQQTRVETGPRRLVDLLLAGGTFAAAIAGFIVPGVPTAPFLLLSQHYLHRATPETYGRLCRLPVVGLLARKADRGGRIWEDRRTMWVSLGWSALTAAAFLIIHPPLSVALAMELGLFAFSGSLS